MTLAEPTNKDERPGSLPSIRRARSIKGGDGDCDSEQTRTQEDDVASLVWSTGNRGPKPGWFAYRVLGHRPRFNYAFPFSEPRQTSIIPAIYSPPRDQGPCSRCSGMGCDIVL